LLIPVFTAFVGHRRMPPRWALISVIVSGGVALIWWLSQFLSPSEEYWLGLQPIFPGLIVSLGFYITTSRLLPPDLPK